MIHFTWENPFGQKEIDPPVPALWVPTPAVAAVSLKEIKKRQAGLLPYIQELRDTALQVVRRIGKEIGGDFFLHAVERPVMVTMLYRDLEYNHVLHSFGPIPITSHPITFPASIKPEVPIFDRLLPTQKILEIESAPNQKSILDSEMQLSLVRQMGITGDTMTPERIVVYPQLLKFIGHWIENIDSPISDLQFFEIAPVPDIRASKGGQNIYAENPVAAKRFQ